MSGQNRRFKVCDACQVAYDTGASECRNTWCDLAQVVVVEKSVPRKKYQQRSKPFGWYRWSSILARSKARGFGCDLELPDVQALILSPCTYCNSIDRIEIDRKNNDLGYTKDNVAPACHRCNTIKSNVATYEEMMFIAGYLGWRDGR